MAQQIVIDPVTRIEGHAKITIQLDDAGKVSDARFHVAEFRGFEKFCEGRPLWEMPGITAAGLRHLPGQPPAGLGQGRRPDPGGDHPAGRRKLRRLMNLGQIVQSHALSFFHLSAPDLLLGMDSDPARRNVFGLIAAEPELAARRHPPAAVRPGDHRAAGRQEDPSGLVGPRRRPGGPPAEKAATTSATGSPRRFDDRPDALDAFKGLSTDSTRRPSSFGNFPSLFMGLVAEDGNWEHYDGKLRFVDADGRDRRRPGSTRRATSEFIGEAVEPRFVPEVAVLQAAGLSRRHLPRRPAGPAQRLHAHGRPAGRRRARRSTATAATARSPRRSSTTTPG